MTLLWPRPRPVRFSSCSATTASVIAILVFSCLSHTTFAFYLPGIAPVDYVKGQPIPVLANKLTSPRSKLPYSLYSLPVCSPETDSKGRMKNTQRVNLGQMLVGERSLPTSFDIRMLQPVACSLLCSVDLATVPAKQLRSLNHRIRQEYSARLNADNMPVVTRGRTRSGIPAFRFGYKLGYVDREAAAAAAKNAGHQYDDDGGAGGAPVYVNNHLHLTILYHRPTMTPETLRRAAKAAAGSSDVDPSVDFYRVVGFEVEPSSIAHSVDPRNPSISEASCKDVAAGPQRVLANETIAYSYSVEFRESDQPWATRWDPLLTPNAQLKQIQWFSIVNSLMIGLFLTGLVGTVLLRTVLRDFMRYQQLDDNDDDVDDATGWKLVHGDVFRPPSLSPLLAVSVGSGAQVFTMALCTQILALLGFLSPANRGGLLSALLSLFVLASVVAGFTSARVYLSMESSTSRRSVTWGAAVLFPGMSFTIFFLLNIAVAFTGSTGAVGFGTLLVLLFMWFGVSVPLVFIGAFIGYRKKSHDHPVRTNQIPRQVPPLSVYSEPRYYVLPAGILPFGTVFMELVFLLNAVNQDSVYYLYGALISVFTILVVTCAEMSIVFTYLSLSCENWRWHWQAFCSTASSGIFVFLYAVYYLMSQPPLAAGGQTAHFMSWVLYVSYMAIVSGAFSLMCGAVGYFSSAWFVRKIYSQIRVD